MRASIVLMASICALPFCVAAQGGDTQGSEQHSEHEQHAGPAGETASNGHSMGAMHEHMEAMREQMARIHAAQDPEERQRLMHEHMTSMQQHMQMMGRMAQGPSASAGPGMRCADGDLACRTGQLESQHESMRQSMDEMRALMGQMMEHLRVAEKDTERR